MGNQKEAWRISTAWHPWRDRPGIRHIPTYHQDGAIYSTIGLAPLFHVSDMESLISTVSGQGLFTLVHDLLNTDEFSYIDELLQENRVTPYLSQQGCSTLRLTQKRKTGFLVPASVWQWDGYPDAELIEVVREIFRLFQFESTTPSSLSEKVLRATLPDYVGIYRPSVTLRDDILKNSPGGRIDKALPAFYRSVKEFDKNKAYLFHSRRVPTPFIAPFCFSGSSLSRFMDFPVGFVRCRLVARSVHPSPLLLEGGIEPVDGEVVDRWLWTGELQDCLNAGYQLLSLHRGYCWPEMSNFMEAWSDILWQKYTEAQQGSNPHVLKVIKHMMVGLPGRFLRKPEQFKLVRLEEASTEDIPLMLNWYDREKEGNHFSSWAIHPEYEQESTALSPQGAYIVAEMRRELYHRMKEETKHGYHVIRSYIDCYSVVAHSRGDIMDDSALSYRNVGTSLGQWKRKDYTDVWAEENRFVGVGTDGLAEMKAPAFSGRDTSTQRIQFWQRYHRIVKEHHLQHG